jgi:NAD(P)-dependent dehydrogenase (short-subunit alcohol dehydrogenase family)
MADAKPLAGQHALVTGGGSGIGLAIARRLGALGASLTLVGRAVDRLEAAAAALREITSCDAVQADVGDADAVRRAFEVLDARGHVLRVLINNAGVAKSAKFAATDASVWEEMLRVNLTGVYYCIQAALPRIVAAGGGRVVTVASTAGLIGYPYVSAYCAAKHGVIGLTRALAAEYALRGVTINAVCPGYTDTDMTQRTVANIVAKTGRTADEARAALTVRNPQQRLVTPDEVAATVAWLCLPEAAAINGQAISVSGGEVMVG